MSNTPYFNLGKPAQTDEYDVDVQNANMDIIDTEMHRPPLTVNGLAPNQTTRDLTITEVPLAGNLSSDEAQVVVGDFIQRTSGGDASISDGQAFLTSIKGNAVHSGYVAQEIDWSVYSESITATLDEATFVAYVANSGTITLTYTTEWSANPALYGFTITGTPANGDYITVDYTKEDRGTITVATPTAFNSTGWNLFNLTAGYAKVVRYSDSYGYRLGGNYSLVEFATTVSGTRSAVSMSDGLFNVPSDGYVFITGGDATTYIYPTWSDWTESYDGDFESYSVDVIDLTEVMLNFPNGLFAVGAIRDEINLNTQLAIHRVERLAYNSTNLAAVIASGVDYDADTNYIYAVLETPTTAAIDLDGTYDVNDHGIEYYSGTSVPVVTETLYGENLKDKLRTDVLTISAQELTAAQKAQVQQNIGIDYGRVKFGADAGSKTVAQFVTDISSYSTGDVILYRVSPTIATALYGANTSLNAVCIIQKASSASAYYSIMYRGAYACGNIAISNNTVTLYWSSETLSITNQSSPPDDVNVATSTQTNLASISLTKGEYLIIGIADWASNATGTRQIWFSDSEGGTQINLASRNNVNAVNGYTTRHQLPIVYRATSNTTIYFVGWQNSGSTLKVQPRYSMIRLK